jgi:hypothetical protein
MNVNSVRKLLEYDPITGEFRWRINPGGKAGIGKVAGTKDSLGYIVIRYRSKGYKAHRLAWMHYYGVEPSSMLDHKNQLKHDNSISNLREATPSENSLNITPPNMGSSSGLRGVSWFSQYGKWKATCQVRGKKIFLGHFDDKHIAYEAVQSYKLTIKDTQP